MHSILVLIRYLIFLYEYHVNGVDLLLFQSVHNWYYEPGHVFNDKSTTPPQLQVRKEKNLITDKSLNIY